MPDPHDILENLRAYLVTQGIVRLPSTAGPLPPLILEPRNGVPAPGEGSGNAVDDTLVLGAYLGGGIPRQPYDSYLRTDIIDIWFRGINSPVVFEKDEEIRRAVTDKRGWMMAALRVEETEQYQALTPIEHDAQAFTFTAAYLFETGGHQ